MNRIWESKHSLPGVMVLAALAVARPPQDDTRLIADEMDELAHGAVGKLIWEGAGTDKVSVATAADTIGYHKVLASLTGFQERLRQAADPGQP
jgi:hypothetical protein